MNSILIVFRYQAATVGEWCRLISIISIDFFSYVFLSGNWFGKWTAVGLYLASWIRNLSVLLKLAHWRWCHPLGLLTFDLFFFYYNSFTQLCITCFVAPACYYHIIARTFVYFTPLHALYVHIFSDCNAHYYHHR